MRVLTHLGCSNSYFCVYGIYEDFSRGIFFCLAQFRFLGSKWGHQGTLEKNMSKYGHIIYHWKAFLMPISDFEIVLPNFHFRTRGMWSKWDMQCWKIIFEIFLDANPNQEKEKECKKLAVLSKTLTTYTTSKDTDNEGTRLTSTSSTTSNDTISTFAAAAAVPTSSMSICFKYHIYLCC